MFQTPFVFHIASSYGFGWISRILLSRSYLNTLAATKICKEECQMINQAHCKEVHKRHEDIKDNQDHVERGINNYRCKLS